MSAVAMPVRLTSSVGLIAMLEEEQNEIKAHALKKLDAVVPDFWAEISEALPDIESLHEDEEFPQRKLAALVASKVYYFLGELGDALTFALGASDLFDVDAGSEYTETLLTKAIDEYCALFVKRAQAQAKAEAGEPSEAELVIDARLVALVERMVESAITKRSYQAAVGIAFEAQRLDIIERVLRLCDTAPGEHEHEGSTQAMLSYCFALSTNLTANRTFRVAVLRALVGVYRELSSPDPLGLCRCLAHLNDASAVGDILRKLVLGTKDDVLVSFQVAFDLVDNCTQFFLKAVSETVAPKPPPAAPVAAEGAEATEPAAPAEAPAEPEDEASKLRQKARLNLLSILSGEVPIALYLEFLCRSNRTDLLLLTNMKKAVDQRNSLTHSAIVVAHALMSAGTTSDTFLRENLDWLSRATNWAKFTATATLGVIHKGHVKQAHQLLAPYLPQAGMSASPFSEGGALYALGIIHANHGAEIRSYLLEALRNAGTNETVQHGAALGVGIAAMATEDDELYEELKGVLFNDSAVAGEAAALAMGLVMLGSASAKGIEEMIGYAHDTAHEKIIRGLALGLAMTMYGRETEADSLVTTLLHDKDPILRYGAMYTIAFAYACTGSNAALRRLLHVAVSDVSDDVRRAAVTAIGFVLAGTPSQTPKVVKLLAESYNPHVRYGATMAVGVSCAGTAMREGLDLLKPMLDDPVDFVRQGALLATSMLLMQSCNHGADSRLTEHRKHLQRVIADKHEETMAKFGAILATGLLDAGGRNMTIQLVSKSGQRSMSGIVGMAVFSHFWFWHPLILFASLALTPTAVIGVNGALAMPKWKIKSCMPPSTFAYPPMTSNEKKVEEKKALTATLSTTNKKKKADLEKDVNEKAAEEKAAAEKAAAEKAAEKAAVEGMLKLLNDLEKKGSISSAIKAEISGAPAPVGKDEGMEVDASSATVGQLAERLRAVHGRGDVSTAVYSELMALKPPLPDGAEEPQPDMEVLENPARVLRTQEKHIALLPNARYVPVAAGRRAGIIVLKDTTPDEEEELLQVTAVGPAGASADEEEPSPPAPFEFTG
ncbi:hypothetical protein AB1Y20_019480 [Prymnesium parvum]|uniref:26S proteasome regulatory subunit RPN2 C-terminal domain-containing protein n=1 Tax=Prymnesium parvum TaxID=97485 RepID=A0AB34JV60_PRYPA